MLHIDIVKCIAWMVVYGNLISCSQVNVAVNKNTSTTSGIYISEQPSDGRVWYPSGAVDGDHDKLNSWTSCFHSRRVPADWTVDLGQEYQLYNISVYIRRNWLFRTANSIIYVDNDPSRVCYTFPSTISDNPTRLTCNETARYVTIKNPGMGGDGVDTLNICEVEIYVCTDGYRGVECDVDCHCDECDRWTGICNSTCTPGWDGERCDRACNGKYGSNCNDSCAARQCSNSSSSCDPVNGTCDSGCLAGWIGHDCTTVCPNSTYGLTCSNNCTNRHCEGNSTCDHVTGSCDQGCEDGWTSIDCTDVCSKTSYGQNCSKNCGNRHCEGNSTCDHVTGSCDLGCAAGWKSFDCTKGPAAGLPVVGAQTGTPGTGVGVIAGAAAAGVLVVLVLVLLTVLLIRTLAFTPRSQKIRKQRKSTTSSSGSQLLENTHQLKERMNHSTERMNHSTYDNVVLQEEKTEESTDRKVQTGVIVVHLKNVAPDAHATTNGNTRKNQMVNVAENERQGTKYKEEEEEEEEDEEEDYGNEDENLFYNDPQVDEDEKNYYNLNQVDSKHAVSVSQLPLRIQKMKENPHLIREEYEALPKDFLYSYEESQNKKNKGKNRFKGYYPYDYNRVVLYDSEGDSDEDYINASFVNGYTVGKRFIAAQGPYKTELFEDFWRMVWQEECPAIVMVTTLVEGGKMKCLRYWPVNGSENYGRFTLTVETKTQQADYVITSLTLQHSQHSKKRQIKHFYFTSWSDHGVPDISGLLTFMRRVQNFTNGQQRPIVVHCSAGIGRTGTYIAVESLVNQATTEGVVDVVSFVTNMRGQRRNMVQTQEQYHFIYKAVSHAVTYGDTSLSVDVIKHLDLDQIVHFTMGNKTVEKHLQILQASHTGAETSEGVTILPSYRSCSGFTLMTSQPDGDEIWNFIFNGDVRILIMDAICQELFSSDSGVTFTKGRDISLSEDVTMCSVTLTNQDGERTVQIQYYQVRGDLNEGTVSVLADSLLQGTGQAEGQATAVVSRSVSSCGLLVLLSNVVSRLQVEEKVDIINDMTRLQQHLPHMIFNMVHVRRCLELCKRWIESTETYANL